MTDHTAAEALAAVQAADSRVDSLLTQFANMKSELETALAKQMTPAIQQAINDVFDVSTGDATKIDAALNANVPAPPPPPAA